jgi:aminoglycoside phosphotransferase (APT) family kinase protein
MNVEEVAGMLPDRFGAVRSVEAIQVGLSGAGVYGVATDAGDYVLRIAPVSRETWQRELVVRRITSDAGIAPTLEWVDDDRRATLTRRIGGRGFTAALAGDSDGRIRALGAVARLLRRLHSLPPDGFVPTDPVAMARQIWSLECERPGFPTWVAPTLAHVDRAERLLADDQRRAPSHNDMNPANVLWDGERAWLVDWEQSGLTHPYYDMAALTTFLRVDDAIGLQLLTAQEGAPLSTTEADTFVALRRLAMVFYGVMFFGLAPALQPSVPGDIEEVPSMAEIYARLGSGTLSLRTPEGQALYGAVLLKRAVLGD